MQNEYQLRLKDLNYNEKLKEATEKFTQELDSDKKNYELLLQAKNDMEMEYEEKIKQFEERHQQQLQALEAQYQQKIMAEARVARRTRHPHLNAPCAHRVLKQVERYQQLVSEKDLQGEKWEERLAVQTEEHERAVQELTDEYEARLNDEVSPSAITMGPAPCPSTWESASIAGLPTGGGARAGKVGEGGLHPGV